MQISDAAGRMGRIGSGSSEANAASMLLTSAAISSGNERAARLAVRSCSGSASKSSITCRTILSYSSWSGMGMAKIRTALTLQASVLALEPNHREAGQLLHLGEFHFQRLGDLGQRAVPEELHFEDSFIDR